MWSIYFSLSLFLLVFLFFFVIPLPPSLPPSLSPREAGVKAGKRRRYMVDLGRERDRNKRSWGGGEMEWSEGRQ